MIRYHESFSTRIFLPSSPSAPAAATSADLREFWWFLRAGGSRTPFSPGASPAARPSRRPHSVPAKG